MSDREEAATKRMKGMGGISALAERYVTLENTLLALLALGVIHALTALIVGIAQPLLDLYAFRQTQTALTSYWILQGGPWIAYETPVLGAPWSIPFEFPVYQLLTSTLAWIGIPLAVAGRLVSFAFFLGTLWPLRMLCRDLSLGRTTFLAIAILFVSSPLYVYWGRTFMIETCALFFAVLWLALSVRFLATERWSVAGMAAAAGTLAVLTKATTFPAFAVLGSLGFLYVFWRQLRAGDGIAPLARLVGAGALIVLLPFAFGFAWVGYSDALKATNEFGNHLTGASLTGWNFGNMAQRLSARLWQKTIGERTLPETLGLFYPLAFAALGATLVTARRALFAALALLGFLIPFFVFTNLHIVHSYYQTANAFFLVFAIGLEHFPIVLNRLGFPNQT